MATYNNVNNKNSKQQQYGTSYENITTKLQDNNQITQKLQHKTHHNNNDDKQDTQTTNNLLDKIYFNTKLKIPNIKLYLP